METVGGAGGRAGEHRDVAAKLADRVAALDDGRRLEGTGVGEVLNAHDAEGIRCGAGG
jgi:ribose 5-phosphate isomerase RpiB